MKNVYIRLEISTSNISIRNVGSIELIDLCKKNLFSVSHGVVTFVPSQQNLVQSIHYILLSSLFK